MKLDLDDSEPQYVRLDSMENQNYNSRNTNLNFRTHDFVLYEDTFEYENRH